MLDSWVLALESENKSAFTIRSYGDSVRALTRWADGAGVVADTSIDTATLRAFLAAELTRTFGKDGRTVSPASVAVHYRNLRVFFGWLAEEEPGMVPVSPMARVRPPEVPSKSKPPFSEDELRALLGAANGGALEDRRDTAIMRVFMDTGMRVSGMAGLRYVAGEPDRSDVRLQQRILVIRLKGGAEQLVPLGRKSAAAIDRYLRARSRHPNAESGWLWVSKRSHLTNWGIRQMLERRAATAGVSGMQPHRFRRTFAHDWLFAGGTENDLMKITGWKTRDMIDVYAGELANERARTAHARLSPGDRI
jgi:site-specific recombinase XerD